MQKIRVVLNFMVAFTLLGLIVASWGAPRWYSWYNTPGGGVALCDCGDITRQTAAKLIDAQIQGGAVGAVLGVIAGVVWIYARRAKKKPTPPTPGAGPTPT